MSGSFTLLGFAAFLTQTVVEIDLAQREALERAAKIVEKEAKRVIGTYDYGWPPLKPETIARKATGDSPLLETGDLRKSIGHKVMSSSEAQVGSDSDKAIWHELGTSRIPPRPFLMGAAVHKEGEVVRILGEGSVKGLVRS